MQDTLVISYEALHLCVTNIAVTNCFKLATVQSRPETAVRPNHTNFVYMSSGYPESYMCAYRPKSVIAQHSSTSTSCKLLLMLLEHELKTSMTLACIMLASSLTMLSGNIVPVFRVR